MFFHVGFAARNAVMAAQLASLGASCSETSLDGTAGFFRALGCMDRMEMLRPFVYRRYLDFSAIEALRSMKQLIQQEVRRKGMASNIKLGAGGIREVAQRAGEVAVSAHGIALELHPEPLSAEHRTTALGEPPGGGAPDAAA